MTLSNRGPIACDLTQIPAHVRERLLPAFRAVLATVIDVQPLPDGYALRFPVPVAPGLIATLGEILEYDRLCCPFLGHAIVDEPWGGGVALHLTGDPGVRGFIARELVPALAPALADRLRAGCAEADAPLDGR